MTELYILSVSCSKDYLSALMITICKTNIEVLVYHCHYILQKRLAL